MQLSDENNQIKQGETGAGATVWLKRIGIILVVVGAIGLLAYLLKGLLSGGSTHKKEITTIKLIPDEPPPPPPPPPPPKDEPKVEPKEVKEVKQEPQPKPEPAPPAEVLKMEGAAGDGPSPFAAGAVTDEYKGGEVGTKIGGTVNKYQFAWYTDLIKTQIEDAIEKDKSLAIGSYKVVVKVWVASSGRIQRYEIVGSSGDADKDALVKKALDQMPPLSEAPPSDMPQPVKLRVTARSVG
jgi:TonB family protein